MTFVNKLLLEIFFQLVQGDNGGQETNGPQTALRGHVQSGYCEGAQEAKCEQDVCPKDLGSLQGDWRQDHPHSGCPRIQWSPRVIKAIREKIGRNPKRSMKKMARDTGMLAATMMRLVRKDLKMTPYRLKKRQLLCAVTRDKRLFRAKVLLSKLKASTAPNIVFSDEKLFTVQQAWNSQNDHVLTRDQSSISSSARTVSRQQDPEACVRHGVGSRHGHGEEPSCLCVHWGQEKHKGVCQHHPGGRSEALGRGSLRIRAIDLPTRWCTIPHLQDLTEVVPGQSSRGLAEVKVAPVIPRPESPRLCHVVHPCGPCGGKGLWQAPFEFGFSQGLLGQGVGRHPVGVCALQLLFLPRPSPACNSGQRRPFWVKFFVNNISDVLFRCSKFEVAMTLNKKAISVKSGNIIYDGPCTQAPS